MSMTAKRAEARNKATSPEKQANRSVQQITPRGTVVTPRGTRRTPSVQSPTIRNKLVQPLATRSSLPSRLQQQRGVTPGTQQQPSSGGGFGSPQRQASPPPAVRHGGCSSRTTKGQAAAAQMTSGGDAGAGQPVQTGTPASGPGQQQGGMAGSPLLGLDFAMLAQRASPCSKHRLETLLQELSQEIGRIASGSGEDEGAGAPPAVPALSHLREFQEIKEVDSVSSTVATAGGPDAKLVERLCERVHGMQVALQGSKRQELEHEVSLSDSPSDEQPTNTQGLEGHQLSYLEKLICGLQAKVDETLLPGEAVGKFRMELSVLEQQKMTLQEEVVRLQQRMDEMGQQHQPGAVGATACGIGGVGSALEPRQRSVSPDPNSSSTSWPGSSGRPGATKPPAIPRLHLGAVQVTTQVATLSPPHSGRAEHGPALLPSRPASLQLPPGSSLPRGQAMTPRALQQAHCGAAQEDATPVITTSGSVLSPAASSTIPRPGLSGSRLHLAASPLHHRTNSATTMVAPGQAQPQPVHQGYGSRPMTPGISQRIQMAEPMNVGAHRVWAYPAVVSTAAAPQFAFQHRG